MEYNAALPARADLSPAPAEMVARFLLFVAPVLGGFGHVFSRISLDMQPLGRVRGGLGLCFEPRRAGALRSAGNALAFHSCGPVGCRHCRCSTAPLHGLSGSFVTRARLC